MKESKGKELLKILQENCEFDFETPRDRNGEFEPKIVPKNKRMARKTIR